MNDTGREIRISQIQDPTNFGCSINDPVWECEGTLAAIRRIHRDGPLPNLARTIRRVETIVNFKDEFGRGDRPDWSEFANAETIWESYARIKAKGK